MAQDLENTVFDRLEQTFLTYADLRDVPALDNNERFVALSTIGLPIQTHGFTVEPSTGDEIFVRKGVARRLIQAQENITNLFPGCQLQAIYGYRSLEVQTAAHEQVKQRILREQPGITGDALTEEAQKFIAAPSIAGHPTGGAVDVRVINAAGQPLDMGTEAHELARASYTFNPFVSKEVWMNRQKLRQAMLSSGFAPFDGEWWHFSYGDKEWARYYNKPGAFYTQVPMAYVLCPAGPIQNRRPAI